MILDEMQVTRLKEIELEMLKEFIKVCEKLNLKYYALGGTLLGAVRHKGFIPWDDDIDVGMFREDYEIFLKEGQKLLPDHLFIQTFETDPEYPHNFAKIRNSNTTFLESSVRSFKINHGVYVDVFPLDRCELKEKRRLFEIGKFFCDGRIVLGFDIEHSNTIKSKVWESAMKLLYLNKKQAVKHRNRLMKSMPNGLLIANFCGAWGEKEIMPLEWFGEPREYEFEGIAVTGPCEYDKYLSQLYGDYMQFPPEEKRVSHHNTEVIDLSKSYINYIER